MTGRFDLGRGAAGAPFFFSEPACSGFEGGMPEMEPFLMLFLCVPGRAG
jgi:hypothetical protein